MLISDDYKELQKDLHARYDYGKGVDSKDCDRIVRGFLPIGRTVLDYGCGQGHLGRLMRPDYDVREYDPVIEGKDAQPEPADAVVCADVLEHIEPDLLDNVLQHILDLTQLRAVLVIATGPSAKKMADGRAAHLIVEGGDWWRDKLSAFFDIIHFEDRSVDGKGILAVVGRKDDAMAMLDERIKLLRKECWREINENADAKPAYALLRVYSKMKMFCEFYDNLRKGAKR